LIFLILLLLFYYLQIQSNIIILLGVIIILLLNDLITKKDHFTTHNELDIDSLINQINNTYTNLLKLQENVVKKEVITDIPFLKVESSCAPIIDKTIEDLSPNPLYKDSLEVLKVPHLDEEGLSTDININYSDLI
jgi:hypothetical protein